MDYEHLNYNLQLNIEKMRSMLEQNQSKSLAKDFILKLAKDNNLEVEGFDDSIYIKKGNQPRAILHLNIDVKESYDIDINGEEKLELTSTYNISTVNSLLVMANLLGFSDIDFDILITNNNIQKNSKNYTALKTMVRSNNIINLNLSQDSCIADEFSALILSQISVPVERFEVDYPYYSYKLCLSNLIGGRAGEDIDKVRLNSIKSLVGVLRKMKSKVDLDITGLEAGDDYDTIPSSGEIYFIAHQDHESALYDVFNLYKNELIEKNLKHEPNLSLEIEKTDEEYIYPITEASFSHLASFVELVPLGAYMVNSINNHVISSVNLASATSLAHAINFTAVYRSLSDAQMEEMLEKTKIAMKISDSKFISYFTIPRWENPDDSLSQAFENAYIGLTGKCLDIVKTQYSLDASIIFKDLNVKMISLGVKYKQGEDKKYYSKLADINLVTDLIYGALANIQPN